MKETTGTNAAQGISETPEAAYKRGQLVMLDAIRRIIPFEYRLNEKSLVKPVSPEAESGPVGRDGAIRLIATKMFDEPLEESAAQNIWRIPSPGTFSEAAFEVVMELLVALAAKDAQLQEIKTLLLLHRDAPFDSAREEIMCAVFDLLP